MVSSDNTGDSIRPPFLTQTQLVPMFNAELAAPGIRGSLVALQQLAITCE